MKNKYGMSCWGSTYPGPSDVFISYDLVSGGCKRVVLDGFYDDASGQYTNECFSQHEMRNRILDRVGEQYFLRSVGERID